MSTRWLEGHVSRHAAETMEADVCDCKPSSLVDVLTLTSEQRPFAMLRFPSGLLPGLPAGCLRHRRPRQSCHSYWHGLLQTAVVSYHPFELISHWFLVLKAPQSILPRQTAPDCDRRDTSCRLPCWTDVVHRKGLTQRTSRLARRNYITKVFEACSTVFNLL